MNMEFLGVVALGGLITWALKTAFIETAAYRTLPQAVVHALEYVPPAVLCALVIPGIFKGEVGLVTALGDVPIDPRIPAALASALIYVATRRNVPTLVGGMAVLYLSHWVQTGT